jgi:hypothetical protein
MLPAQILKGSRGNTHVTCELQGSRKQMGFGDPPCRLLSLKGELSADRARRDVVRSEEVPKLNIAALSAEAPV